MSFFETAQVVFLGGAAAVALIAIGAIITSVREQVVLARADCREQSLIQHGERSNDC